MVLHDLVWSREIETGTKYRFFRIASFNVCADDDALSVDEVLDVGVQQQYVRKHASVLLSGLLRNTLPGTVSMTNESVRRIVVLGEGCGAATLPRRRGTERGTCHGGAYIYTVHAMVVVLLVTVFWCFFRIIEPRVRVCAKRESVAGCQQLNLACLRPKSDGHFFIGCQCEKRGSSATDVAEMEEPLQRSPSHNACVLIDCFSFLGVHVARFEYTIQTQNMTQRICYLP